jgi:hypothetical protein
MASWDDTLKRRSEFATLHKEVIDADREQAGYNDLISSGTAPKCFPKPLLVDVQMGMPMDDPIL